MTTVRCVGVYVDRDLPSGDLGSQNFDSVLGVTPWEDFPGIILESLEDSWTMIRYEFQKPSILGDGPIVHRILHVDEIDEAPRADLVRRYRERT